MNLLRNLEANENCTVKIVVDLSNERRAFVKSKYPNIHTSDNFYDIVQDDSIDAVVVSTPVATHYDLSKNS